MLCIELERVELLAVSGEATLQTLYRKPLTALVSQHRKLSVLHPGYPTIVGSVDTFFFFPPPPFFLSDAYSSEMLLICSCRFWDKTKCCDLKKKLLNPQAFHSWPRKWNMAWPLRMEVSTLLCFCDTKSCDFIID